MNFKLKARIQNAVDVLPERLSYPCYYWLQRHFGGLRKPNPTRHLLKSAHIIRNIRRSEVSLNDATCLEIGTGRTVDVPIGLWLCGPGRIITIDLNPYLRSGKGSSSNSAMAIVSIPELPTRLTRRFMLKPPPQKPVPMHSGPLNSAEQTFGCNPDGSTRFTGSLCV